jgi:tRNA A37 threonylcarbamoyladenosine dehydratase
MQGRGHSVSYAESFSRNWGLVSAQEQAKLRSSCVAIAGLGGVGGAYAITLARLGVGRFHLADFDSFELANFNRQQGAMHSTLGQRKVEVIQKMILDINPEAEVTLFQDGVTESNVLSFLRGVDAVADAIDFYALEARRLLFAKAREAGIPVVTSGPIAMTTTLQVFTPTSMSFEDYFAFAICKTDQERLAGFMAGTAPGFLNRGQIDPQSFDFEARRAPSIGTAIQLCAGLAGTQIFLLLTGRECHCISPAYLQFDPVKGRLARGILRWGNRGPLQRIKMKIALKMLQGSKGKR